MNVATPKDAGTDVVPLRVPVPEVICAVTVADELVTVFPELSWTRTMGWLDSVEPEVAPPG